jgi:hypothetical protein
VICGQASWRGCSPSKCAKLGSSSEKKVADFGRQEHQKVFHSNLHSLPSSFPKLMPCLNRLLKKLLKLNIPKNIILFINCLLVIIRIYHICARCQNRPLFSRTKSSAHSLHGTYVSLSESPNRVPAQRHMSQLFVATHSSPRKKKAPRIIRSTGRCINNTSSRTFQLC